MAVIGAEEVSSMVTVEFTAKEAQAIAEAILGFMMGARPDKSFDIKALQAANSKLDQAMDKSRYSDRTTKTA